MRATLLSWLPADLRDARILDAGCGTGALAVEAALRGANVTAIDLSPTLIQIAADRVPKTLGMGCIQFLAGDMLSPKLGSFDYVVAMDSLIHYRANDSVRMLRNLADRTNYSILFTFAPKTPALAVMHLAGKLFPRGDRAPSIEPIAEDILRTQISAQPDLNAWKIRRSTRISSGFYTSQAMELSAC
jgi:magnesium-protoporphyrin O-methyltransferase